MRFHRVDSDAGTDHGARPGMFQRGYEATLRAALAAPLVVVAAFGVFAFAA